MYENIFKRFDEIETKEIAPGFYSKLIHTDTNTINFIEVNAGCAIPRHRHVHQQCSFVLEGIFELTVDNTPHQLDKGIFAVIPADAWHSGRAITNCRLIDIFSPAREDYQNL